MASPKGPSYISGAAYPPRHSTYHSWQGEGSSSNESSMERNLSDASWDSNFMEQVKKRVKINKRQAIADELAEVERQRNQEEYFREKAVLAEEGKKVEELLQSIRASREYVSPEERDRRIEELKKKLRKKRQEEEGGNEERQGKKKKKSVGPATPCSVM